MKLSIIIVSYNVKHFLEQCLCSVQKAIQKTETEVFVVDNCSSDGSVAFLKNEFPFVEFIVNDKNEGFAKANNIALQKCSGDHILFLNPDTIITESILQHSIDFFVAHKKAGAIGVRMIDGSGNFLPESKRSFPTASVSFFKLSGLSTIFPRSKFFNRYALGFLHENEIHEVDVLCGAFLLTRKEVLYRVGGFDEAFFMYGEDIDICYRIQKAGYKNFYLGTEVIIHFKGESSGQDSLNHIRMFYDAMYVFVKKHYKGNSRWMMNFLLHTGIFTRKLISLLSSHSKIEEKNFSEEHHKKFLLIGDPIASSEAQNIIHQNFPEAEIKKLQSLHSLNQENSSFDQLIFCAGNFSYSSGIEFMISSRNKNFQYYWHGYHTKSVVGSSNKNLTGKVFTILPLDEQEFLR